MTPDRVSVSTPVCGRELDLGAWTARSVESKLLRRFKKGYLPFISAHTEGLIAEISNKRPHPIRSDHPMKNRGGQLPTMARPFVSLSFHETGANAERFGSESCKEAILSSLGCDSF